MKSSKFFLEELTDSLFNMICTSYVLLLVSQLFRILPRIKVISNYKILLVFLFSYLLIYVDLLQKSHDFCHFALYSKYFLHVTFHAVLSSLFLPLGTVLQTVFYCQSLVSTYYVLAFWWLFVSRHQVSGIFLWVFITFFCQKVIKIVGLLIVFTDKKN